MAFNVLFTCVSNRVRSVFSEYLFPELLAQKDDKYALEIKTFSAGFIPRRTKDMLTDAGVVFPQPFYNRQISEITRAVLEEKGIIVPADRRSRELVPKLIEDADLIITAAIHQKEELLNMYPEAFGKVYTLREAAMWKGYIVYEDVRTVHLDKTFFQHCEQDPEYVSQLLCTMEALLKYACSTILRKAGLNDDSLN
ncbi:MAG: hypothetical protein JRJ45_01390 [Deltaproteobacteria bacterium]|nr:hypothetical protein [Deltaproteobacteria bacterium]